MMALILAYDDIFIIRIRQAKHPAAFFSWVDSGLPRHEPQAAAAIAENLIENQIQFRFYPNLFSSNIRLF